MRPISIRLAIVALAIALAMVNANAQSGGPGMGGGGHGHKHQDQKPADTADKPKVDEKAYQAALKSVPNKPSDPWSGAR
jgi:hypothetical protein